MTDDLKARVFNIERCSTEDGDGIRTVVFFKGCHLRCKWCANPESQDIKKELMFLENLCSGCSKCIETCPLNAIEFNENFGYLTDNSKCNICKKCINGCLSNSRVLMGEDYSSKELFKEILKDKKYFLMSNGGITFSGGEPLIYSKFIKEISSMLKNEGIGTLIETCGYIKRENLVDILDCTDTIYFDIKHMDSPTHKELTGRENELILSNLEFLNENFKGKLVVRYAVIPNHNDKHEDIVSFLTYINELKNIKNIHFLPYHRLGATKYKGLGRVYPLDGTSPLKVSDLEYLFKYQDKCEFTIKIL